MYSFRNDYSELAHQEVLKALSDIYNEQNSGYGLDVHSERASQLIKKHISNSIDADIHFLVGGTSTNKIVISHALKPYEAVIAVNSGHINVHETGAIEANGHKILLTDGVNGKITPSEITRIVNNHIDEHMVVPKMVYISNATEIGSIYSKAELEKISVVCQKNKLYLFLDGARLGTALTSEENDLSLSDIANLCDIFYIGGTKNGAIFGEALVIINDDLKENFRFSIKQNGGMLAKGYSIGVQFERLFSDNLFFDLAKHANLMAKKFKNGIIDLCLSTYYDSPSNLQFIKFTNKQIESLQKNYDFEIWEDLGNEKVIRLVFSFATSDHAVDELLKSVKNII